jgi:hypothetical protein
MYIYIYYLNLLFFLNLLKASYNVAHTKKYCCFSLNSFPLYDESFGYKTLEIYSARCLDKNIVKFLFFLYFYIIVYSITFIR